MTRSIFEDNRKLVIARTIHAAEDGKIFRTTLESCRNSLKALTSYWYGG
jgi:hypothetical protein